MIGFIILLLSLVLAWALVKGGSKKPTESDLEQRNLEWAQFIASYSKRVKTKQEKSLIKKMLSDIKNSGLPIDAKDLIELAEYETFEQSAPLENHTPKIYGDDQSQQIEESILEPIKDTQPSDYPEAYSDVPRETFNIDGPSLLLYFGAFLFIASAGLFVAFGQFSGTLKTIIVFALVACIYSLGLWLFNNNQKFQQVGLTFAGIGLAIAPLVGLTAYNYVFNQSSGDLIWFFTSIFCLGLYAHAMIKLKKPLIDYIFIFTFLSLFESGVSILNAPIYYFGWGLAAVGIINLLVTRLKGLDEAFKNAANTTSVIFLPLALIVSLVMAPTEGVMQLSVSLALGTTYYIMFAQSLKDETQIAGYYLLSHVLGLSAIATFSYALSKDLVLVGKTLLIANILQITYGLIVKIKNNYSSSYIAVTAITAIVTFILSLKDTKVALASLIALTLINLTLWLKYKDNFSLMFGMISLPVIPLYISYFMADPTLKDAQVSFNLLISLIGLIAIYTFAKSKINESTIFGAKVIVLVVTFGVILLSLGSDKSLSTFLLSYIAIAIIWLLALYHKEKDFILNTSILVSIPIAKFLNGGEELVYAASVALLVNIYGALKYREELFRWVGSFLWFVFPMLFNISLSLSWAVDQFIIAYFVVVLGYILARSIARGVVFAKSNIPLISYDRNKSVAYVLGYIFSMFTVITLSFASEHAQLTSSIALGLIILIIYVLAKYIEKSDKILMIIPILAQMLLFTAIRPTKLNGLIDIYAISSLALATFGYWLSSTFEFKQNAKSWICAVTVLSAYTAPFLAISSEHSWSAPFVLLFAGVLTLYHIWGQGQIVRELSGGVISLAVMWILYYYGIRETQAYTHVIAAQLAIYAYFRHIKKDYEISQTYIVFTLIIATVPLTIQAISGVAGGLYGWWLLLEQIGFMLIGLTVKNKLMTYWGLYVAIGAVLYQLRNLGWAAMTFLAIVIIGIAIYKIANKLEDEDQYKK